MNSLERTLIEKAGYDNGWEITVESAPERVILASALHRARARICKSVHKRWRIVFPPGQLAHELNRETAVGDCGELFHASNDTELGLLLNRAAKLARSLPNIPEIRFAEAVENELSKTEITQTEVERLVRQRVGQDIFRQSLMDYWGGACAVTGIAIPELLRASHIKPWAECASDAERLNVFNGFLLCAHLDALFDRHLITFDERGALICADSLAPQILTKLGIQPYWKLRWITPGHEVFLNEHRAVHRPRNRSLNSAF